MHNVTYRRDGKEIPTEFAADRDELNTDDLKPGERLYILLTEFTDLMVKFVGDEGPSSDRKFEIEGPDQLIDHLRYAFPESPVIHPMHVVGPITLGRMIVIGTPHGQFTSDLEAVGALRC